MKLVSARSLPDDPIDAAAKFYAAVVPEVRDMLVTQDLPVCIMFDPADHRHIGWRRAGVQSLARAAAPRRINAVAVAAADDKAVLAVVDYLRRSPGVTGQYLPLDGQGAGDALG